MERELMIKLIAAALADLREAVKELEAPTHPETPMPRPRVFELSARLVWPAHGWDARGWVGSPWVRVGLKGGPDTFYLANSGLAGLVVDDCGGQPRKVLRALRRIQAAAAWCRARAEGRGRAAQEILRQQAKALQTLEAEAALLALGK